jgi:hypothetical protein
MDCAFDRKEAAGAALSCFFAVYCEKRHLAIGHA